MRKHRVMLTAEEREQLRQLLARGKADVRKLKHAQILVKADEAAGGAAWSDARIVKALEVGLALQATHRRDREYPEFRARWGYPEAKGAPAWHDAKRPLSRT
ncbi:hypothetical protein J2852_006126, partial [Azospirillum soli]|nr:hypothetical protein [Azospirillum soli]